MENFFTPLDLDVFKEHLLKYAISPFACDIIYSLRPFQVESQIEDEQGRIGEAFDIFGRFDGKFPDSKIYYEFYKKLKDPYGRFTVEDLLTFGRFHRDVANFKKEILNEYELKHLKEIFSNIFTLSELTDGIFEKISDDGTIKDSASEELYQLRKESRSTKAKLNEILSRIINSKDADKFVQERIIKEYNNRLVLLLRQNFRQFMTGIVHNISGTGLTLYVEPTSVVELNNKYQEIISLEELEVRRILAKILEKIKSHLYEVTQTINSMSKLYYYQSLLSYYGSRKICFPTFGEKISVTNLHHPIIYDSKRENSVPIDFKMGEEITTVVITGPNAGGKTAALKSIGLNTVIAKCGLPIFALYAELINTPKIFADIGDQQSLVMDLSTFTSHMVNIRNITNDACKDALILLDELGTGTDPKEGEAIALAILEYLASIKSRTIVTTHFSGVRNFALRNKNALLYGVDFDYEKLEPRYRLVKNLVGKSDPLIIAKKLNFNEKILEIAKKIIDEEKNNAALTFEELNQLKIEIEKERIDIEEKVRKLDERESILQEREKELSEKLTKKELELLEEAYGLLHSVKNIKELSKNEVSALKNVIEDKLDKIKESKKVKDINVGDMVFLEKYGKIARVLEIAKNRAYVDMEGMKVHIMLSDIIGHKVEHIKTEKKNPAVHSQVDKRGGYEIVLVGKTVEDAWNELDLFIDKALISGWDRIYVVHGRGTGALRKGLHELLRKDKRVKSFRLADLSEGGQAVTIVEL